MEILMKLADSTGLGALFGIVGGWLTRREERKTQQVKNKHEIDMRDRDIQEMEIQNNHELTLADKKMEQTRLEGDITEDIKNAEAFAVSIANQAKATGIMIVDAIRGLMRPLITTYLLILTTFIAYKVGSKVGGLDAIPAAELFELYGYIIKQVVVLCSTAIFWYFASRPSRSDRKALSV